MAKEYGLEYAANRVVEATGVLVIAGTPIIKRAAEPFISQARFRGSKNMRIIAHLIFDELYTDKKDKENK